MENKLAVALGVVLAFGIVTAWITDGWAVYGLYTAVFLLGAVYLAGRLIHPGPLRLSALLAILAAAPLWAAVQVATGVSVNPSRTINAALLWTSNAVVFFLAMQLFADSRRRQQFRTVLVYAGAALAVESLLQLYNADTRIFWYFKTSNTGTVMGPIPYHNHFSALMLLMVPAALYRALTDHRKLVSYSLMTAAMAGAVFASGSRSGAALVALEVVTLVVSGAGQDARSLRSRIAMAVLVVGVVAGGVLVAGTDLVWQRLQEGYPVRLSLNRSSLDMIRAKPWTGFGLGAWPSAYPMYARFDDGLFANQAHNDWLQWPSEGGILWGLVLGWFAVAISARVVRSRWSAGLPAVLLLAGIDYPFQKPIVAALFFVVAGALVGGDKRRST